MTGLEDDPLWNPGGAPDPALAEIERKLAPLAWRPRPLPLPPAIVARESPDRSGSMDHSTLRRWPALIAGLAMAATVLGAMYFVRHESEDPAKPGQPDSIESIESIEPAGQPQRSPDLRDPFSPTPDSNAPKAGDLVDPPTPPTQSDLKDPFARNPDHRRNRPAQRPDEWSSDLKDPFSPDRSSQSNDGPILDPFRDEPSSPSKQSGSDLKDPFARPH